MINIYEKNEYGFIDLQFEITKFTKSKTHFNIEMKGIYKNEEVGFSTNILDEGIKTLNASDEKGEPLEIKLSGGRVNIVTLGSLSDKFLQALAELYGIKIPKDTKLTNISLIGIALEGEITNIETENLKIKCFFDQDENGNEYDEYAEIYLNINVQDKLANLNEKDQEYREAIITLLSA